MSDNEGQDEGRGISFFEKFLPVWVALCIIVGVLLSQFVPGLAEAINLLSVGTISIPIGICLFFMMYPAMLNIQASEIKKLGKNPKPIILTLFSNWVVAPLVGTILASVFLRGHPDPEVASQLTVAVILLTASPCTAMVLVWGWMAKGNQEQNVITTSINTITIIIGYAPLVVLLTGIQAIWIDPILLLISAGLFIGLPLASGVISKKIIIKRKSEEWFDDTYRPIVGKIAIVALLTTLIVLFALNGKTLLENPDLLVLISFPLLIGFGIVVGFNILITKLTKLRYKEASITIIIGSSSHFEIAIATAISLYGIGSYAALGTTMGLFWEIPIMLGLVYLGRYLGKRGFFESEKKRESNE